MYSQAAFMLELDSESVKSYVSLSNNQILLSASSKGLLVSCTDGSVYVSNVVIGEIT